LEPGHLSGGSFSLSERRNALGFWLGSAGVSAGVLLHLPMFWMTRRSGFILAGMPMDDGMLWGMALIVVGIAVVGYGLLPKSAPRISVQKSSAAAVAIPAAVSLVLVAIFGRETRGRDLRELEGEEPVKAYRSSSAVAG
jgi:drug/metabolite transporter (DMT)-like permease